MQKLSLIVLVCLLAACAPSTDAINTAIAETQAVQPFASSTPIHTQPVTPIKYPTETPTMTPAPTKTPLSTPGPATRTAAATTATKSAENAQASATALFKIVEVTQIAKYTRPVTKELVTYPNNFKGKLIMVRGQAFNITPGEGQPWTDGRAREFQLRLDGTGEIAYIVMLDPFTDIFENKWVIVYGTGEGEHCELDASGQQICQPLIMGDFYDFYEYYDLQQSKQKKPK